MLQVVRLMELITMTLLMVQLTLYNYKGQLGNNYNLLFADIIIITVPMLILFLFFNKRIVAGMVAGAVKG